MAFINTIPAREAHGDVLEMYTRQQGAWGYVPDYAKVFCHRPGLMARWGMLLAEVKRPVDERRLELATFAAAHELRNSSCSLAHGAKLAKLIGEDAVIAIANGRDTDALSDAELAIIAFARGVARDAGAITADQIADLRERHGLDDADIFDIAAIAASRAFFTKVLDALGSEPDMELETIGQPLTQALTVGRPIADTAAERLPQARYPAMRASVHGWRGR